VGELGTYKSVGKLKTIRAAFRKKAQKGRKRHSGGLAWFLSD